MLRDPVEDYGFAIIVAVITITLVAVISSSKDEIQTKAEQILDKQIQETTK